MTNESKYFWNIFLEYHNWTFFTNWTIFLSIEKHYLVLVWQSPGWNIISFSSSKILNKKHYLICWSLKTSNGSYIVVLIVICMYGKLPIHYKSVPNFRALSYRGAGIRGPRSRSFKKVLKYLLHAGFMS